MGPLRAEIVQRRAAEGERARTASLAGAIDMALKGASLAIGGVMSRRHGAEAVLLKLSAAIGTGWVLIMALGTGSARGGR